MIDRYHLLILHRDLFALSNNNNIINNWGKKKKVVKDINGLRGKYALGGP